MQGFCSFHEGEMAYFSLPRCVGLLCLLSCVTCATILLTTISWTHPTYSGQKELVQWSSRALVRQQPLQKLAQPRDAKKQSQPLASFSKGSEEPCRPWQHEMEGVRNSSLPALSGYVVADGFREQLSRAVRTYYQLAELAHHWNMQIVEPHMAGGFAGLSGLPDFTSFRYGEFYNVSAVYKELDRCLGLGGRKLVSSPEDFLVHAPRQFVLLNFFKDKGNAGNTPGHDVFNCINKYAIGGNLIPSLEKKLNHYFENENDGAIRDRAITVHGQQYKFKGVHAICVNGWGFSIENVTSELASVAKKLSPSSNTTVNPLTVVIPQWREIRTNPWHTFFYIDCSYPWNRSLTCDSFTIPHGRLVVSAANAFMHSLNLSHLIIGIHIRIEKLAITEGKHKGFWKRCLPAFGPAVRSLQTRFNSTGGDIVAIHDQGKFSSFGCHPTRCPRIKADFLQALNSIGGRVVYYEPTDFGQRANTGLASLVEKEFLSRVDYLITLGDGLFQRSIVSKFVNRHGGDSSDYTALCRIWSL